MRPNNGKIEDEVLDHLREARDRIQDMNPDDGLRHRLNAIEESLGALAVYLDMAFGEMRGEVSEE
jgi:hypothetical protein